MALPVNRPLNVVRVFAYNADMSTAGSSFAVFPTRGKITKIGVVAYAAVTSAPNVLTAKIATVAVTLPTWTVTHSGAAAGDVVEVTPSAANFGSEGQNIEFITDGAGSGTVPCMFYADILVA